MRGLYIVALALLSVGVTATEIQAAWQVPAADAIARLNAAFMTAIDRRDARGAVDGFYVEDAVLMPPNRPLITGRDAITRTFQRLLDLGLTSFRLTTAVVESQGNLAYERGVYQTVTKDQSGAETVQDGKYVVVFRCTTPSWRAIVDIFNTNK